MHNRYIWWFSLFGFSVVLSILMLMPQLLHKAHPLYRGIPVQLNSDEPVYLARVQESLSGRPELAAEAFTGHPHLVGTQVAFIEAWYGRVFRATGWRAAHVLDFIDAIAPVLIFLSLVLFFRLSGFSRWYALGGAAAFSLLQLYNLGRPIHMRASFFLMLWVLIAVSYAVRGNRWGTALGGFFLGLLIGVYFWSFSFAWAFWGIFFAWELLERNPKRRNMLAITGGIGLLIGLPAIMHLLNLSAHPLYEYGSFRSGMHPGRAPESWPYAIIFFTMVVSVLAFAYKYPVKLKPYRGVCVIILAAFVYANQQVVHGITFNFVSHGIFSLATAAVGMVLLYLATRNRVLIPGALAACVYLAAIGYDGRFVLGQWNVQPGRFADQHLITSLPALDALPRGRILSDPATQSFLAGHTHHDIVYSIYLKNVLMTHRELAMRFCLTQMPLAPDARIIKGRGHLIFPDATAAFGGDTRQQELDIVFSACAEADIDPATAIAAFEVSHIFWNKAQEPLWDIARLGLNLTEVASGDTWIFYHIDS